MKRGVLLVLVGVVLAATVVLAEDAPAADTTKSKPALLVIDIQNAYLPMMAEQDRDQAMWLINYAIDVFRKRGFPVIRVYHTDLEHGPPPGSESFEFPESVHIKPEDPMVVKNYPSSFKRTELEKILREQECDTVFLVGLSAVGCVLSTYFDAKALDFRTFMIKDAVFSHRADLTSAVEEICEAVGLEAVDYMLVLAEE